MTPNGMARYANTAHFPGSGPPLETCNTCAAHAAYISKGDVRKWVSKDRPSRTGLKLYCLKWSELMGGKKPSPISRNTPACKYWGGEGKDT